MLQVSHGVHVASGIHFQLFLVKTVTEWFEVFQNNCSYLQKYYVSIFETIVVVSQKIWTMSHFCSQFHGMTHIHVLWTMSLQRLYHTLYAMHCMNYFYFNFNRCIAASKSHWKTCKRWSLKQNNPAVWYWYKYPSSVATTICEDGY